MDIQTIMNQNTMTDKTNNFKRLCEITAEMIDNEKLTNPCLSRLLKQLIQKRGQYIFCSSRKGHTDHNESGSDYKLDSHRDYSEVHTGRGRFTHGDENDACHEDKGYYSDYAHTDHVDHDDSYRDIHKDNNYSESSSHTDSWGGHKDYNESKHVDEAHEKKH